MIIGPFTMHAKVHIVNDETRQVGSAEYSFAPGQPVTVEAMHKAVGATLAALPDGFRLMEADSFFNDVIIKDKTGQRGNFALPQSFAYDAAALEATGRAAYTPPPNQRPKDEEDHDDFDDEDDEW